MNPAPAPPFEVIETPGGRLYRLPPRVLGSLRCLALIPLGPAGVGLLILWTSYQPRLAQGPLTEWEWVGFGLLTLAYIRIGYWLLSIAATIWCGQAEVEVGHDGTLRASDRAGWFRTRLGRARPGVLRKLILKELITLKELASSTSPGVLWHLLAETHAGRKVWIALGYSREVLTPLANALAQQLSLAPHPVEQSPIEGVIEQPAVEQSPDAPAPVPLVVEVQELPSRDVLVQPADSRVKIERHPDGLTLTVPRQGIANAYGGLVFLGALFLLIGTGMTIAGFAPVFQGNPQWPSGVVIPGLVFASIGTFVFLAAVVNGLREVVLAVVGDKLLTFETSPFGSRRREFVAANLLDVACGPSNTSVNNKRLPQLQIVGKDDTKINLMTGRDETELLWMATVLRQALGIPSEPPERRPKPVDPAKPWERPRPPGTTPPS